MTSNIFRAGLGMSLVALLSACDGGNPVQTFGPDDVGSGIEDDLDAGDPDTSQGNIYGGTLNDDLTMNALAYDADEDELVINNLPFDGSDQRYSRTIDNLGGGPFDVYENVEGRRDYFAVFSRSGNSQVSAVGTGSYVDFGQGGLTAQRRNSDTELPTGGQTEYVYTGQYAGVAVAAGGTGTGDVRLVTGNVELDVDFADFDVSGAVEGLVLDREYYDANGNFIGRPNNYIALTTAGIDFDNATINVTDATAIEFGTGSEAASGEWRGVFTGPDGEEIAGIVVIEGTAGVSAEEVRESGAFIVFEN